MGTILDVNFCSYIDSQISAGKAYILDQVTNTDDINAVVARANNYMGMAQEVGVNNLRDNVINEHVRDDIDGVYLPDDDFSKYNVYNENCLSFMKAVLDNSSRKLNDFYNGNFIVNRGS